VFHTRPEETRKIGRPKLRWEDGVIQDIRALEAGNHRRQDEAYEEGQGPHTTVKPVMMMMMMMMMKDILNLSDYGVNSTANTIYVTIVLKHVFVKDL
jgi:hypothetical protein